MTKGGEYNLEARVAEFAARMLAVCEALPPKIGAAHLRDQLFRSASSVAANYAEATVPESRKDFAHKMNIALKELVESRMWLRIIIIGKYLPSARLSALLDEADELVRIFIASLTTARRNLAFSKAAVDGGRCRTVGVDGHC